MTPEEIQNRGWEALVSELGPVNAARFVMQNKLGSGDYTAERDDLLKNQTVEYVVARIQEKRMTYITDGPHIIAGLPEGIPGITDEPHITSGVPEGIPGDARIRKNRRTRS